MAEASMPKRSEDDCDMVTSLQEPFLSKAELTLHEAARTNRRAEVDRLVKLVKVDCRNSLDRTALHMAASKGHKGIVQLLIDNKASVELTDKFGMSPLMWATYFGHKDVVQYLIEKTANVKRRNKLGMHVLHISAEQNHADLVKLFLAKTKRTVLDDTEKNGLSAVMLAAAKGHLETVECLIECEANLLIRDSRKRTILHLAADSATAEMREEKLKECAAVLRKLLSTGNKVRDLLNEKDDSDRAPIHYAVEKGQLESVACLLEFGANPDEPAEPPESDVETIVAKRHMSPLQLAAEHGHVEIMNLLAESGADVDAANNIGYTALHYAAIRDSAAEVYILVKMGCDLAAKSNRLQTAMHLAAEQNKIEAAEALLLSGTPLNIRDKTGKTPLILATRGNCVCIVDMIIKAERHREKIQRAQNNRPAPWDAAAREDQLDAAAAFIPDGYDSRLSVNEVKSIENELTEDIIRDTGAAPPAFRLREFNQPYAEEFKQFLWKLAFKHLRHDEWKKLAAFWYLRLDHLQAIEQQGSDESSFKQHGYRLLCIWFHGIGGETPIRELYEALVEIGRRPLAEKVRQKLDRSVEYYSAGRRQRRDGGRCALQ